MADQAPPPPADPADEPEDFGLLMDSHAGELEGIEAMHDEIVRLRAALEAQQQEITRLRAQLDDPGTTHYEGCHEAGRKHWSCALERIEALRAQLAITQQKAQWFDWLETEHATDRIKVEMPNQLPEMTLREAIAAARSTPEEG